jgi:hypothetical protein
VPADHGDDRCAQLALQGLAAFDDAWRFGLRQKPAIVCVHRVPNVARRQLGGYRTPVTVGIHHQPVGRDRRTSGPNRARSRAISARMVDE